MDNRNSHMEAQNKLTLKEIYIKALAKGLTAKEAAFEYGCNYISLLNRGPENGLPPLASHWKRKDQRNLEKMTNEELQKLRESFNAWASLTDEIIKQRTNNGSTNQGSQP